MVSLRAVLFSSLVVAVSATSNHQKRQGSICAAGSYTSTGKCQPCPPGSYSTVANSYSCTTTSPGFYAPGGGTSPQNCGAGNYCPSSGAGAPTRCPAGTVCPTSNLVLFLECTPGTYSPTAGSTAATCSLCPAGSFTSLFRSTGCCQCCPGWWSLGAAIYCTKCVGTFYSLPGSTNPLDCKLFASQAGNYQPSLFCDISLNRQCPSFNTGPSTNVRKRDVPKKCARPGYKSCAISSIYHTRTRFECVDIANDSESCGGCVGDAQDGKVSDDGGRNCGSIPHVDIVNCQRGECIIDSCARGFKISADGQTCEKDNNVEEEDDFDSLFTLQY